MNQGIPLLMNFIAGAAQGGMNPQTGQTNTFGERLLHGVAAAGEGYDRWEEGQQQITAGGKAADAFRKFMGKKATSMTGIPDAAWGNMSPMEKMSSMAGQIKSEAMQQAQAQVQTMKDAQDQREEEAGGLARWAQMLNDQMQPPTGPPSPEGQSLLQQFNPMQRLQLGALAKMGETNPRLAAPLLKGLFEQFGAGNTLGFTEDPVSGFRFATYGKELTSSGMNPGKATPKVMEVDDGNGGTIQVLVDPKTGRGTQLRGAPAAPGLTDAQLLQSYDRQEATLHRDANMKPDDRAAALAKIDAARAEVIGRQKPAGKAAGKTAAGPAKGGSRTPTREDVTYLAQHPEMKGAFEAQFGKGSAERELKDF